MGRDPSHPGSQVEPVLLLGLCTLITETELMELLQILVAWVQLLKVFGQVQNLRGTVDQLLVRNVENLLELLDLINGVSTKS